MTTRIDEQDVKSGPAILVAGLGNSLLQDDGIGVHAALAMQECNGPSLCCCEVGTAVLDALHLLEWADRVLAIDAMEAGGEPGSIYLIGDEGVAGGPIQASLHELSLKTALGFFAPEAKPEIVVLGVEPARIDYSLELSPELQRALPRVVAVARSIIAYWQDPMKCREQSIEKLFEAVLGAGADTAAPTTRKDITQCLA
ncbi:MAG: hydrogenase maturation protease [Armatimonadia bacterium]